MKIPIKITPDPIVEAIVEFRFVTDLPPDAVFGVIYSAFKGKYGDPEKLPILQLPEEIRSNDPALAFKAHYRFQDDPFIFQVGPTMFSLACKKSYIGWGDFSKEILEHFSRIIEQGVVSKFVRLGIRYINFFDFDIFEKLNLRVLMNEAPIETNQMAIRFEKTAEAFTSQTNITNKSTVIIDDDTKEGSIIDIDTYVLFPTDETTDPTDIFNKMPDILHAGRLQEKKMFFSLLKDDYIDELEPEYEE